MPLGYRGIFDIPEHEDVIRLAEQQFRSWLTTRHWCRADDWHGPGLHGLGPNRASP